MLDLKRVVRVDAAAAAMLATLVHDLAQRRQQLVLTRVRRGELMAAFDAALHPHDARAVSYHPQLDLGLEWCERVLLQAEGFATATSTVRVIDDDPTAQLARHQLCEGLAAEDLHHLRSCVEVQVHEAGATLVSAGDAADALFLLTAGEVSVVVNLPRGGVKRLATLSAGMSFGETALIHGGTRTADVRADTAVQCCVLTTRTFECLTLERPTLATRLLRNLMASLSRTTQRLTAEVAALEG